MPISDQVVYTETPFNAGTHPEALLADFYTANARFFVRNHGGVPQVDPATFRLHVGGQVEYPLEISLDELKQDFERHTVSAVLQCAGNRRVELETIAPIPNEIIWNLDAIGNATWAGARLGDVLAKAGVQAGAAHVAFLGLDETPEDARGFGGSVPLTKAQQDETLIAYAMNDEPLPAMHGYPLRMIVPGYIGARSVKWLSHITVQETPSDNYFQQQAYRLYPPQFSDKKAAQGYTPPMISELPVNAIILTPQTRSTHPTGQVTVGGVAVGQEGARLKAVEISLDGGASWGPVAHASPSENWTWQQWEHPLVLPSGEHKIAVRATDVDGNTQPPALNEVWNFKGYLNNAYHQITIQVK